MKKKITKAYISDTIDEEGEVHIRIEIIRRSQTNVSLRTYKGNTSRVKKLVALSKEITMEAIPDGWLEWSGQLNLWF